ncbi:DNA polymerase III subunit alpha [Halalkalibacter oceani]|uniref:DNA polymerase III subunit alpha n=1 Tax=Halalkalibacter oceani TaxID=1653776 RepID=UPI003398ADFD
MVVQSYVYSEYSLLSATNRLPAFVKKAKELGYQALALSDRHVMYGAVPFYQACVANQIKPIFGLELTIQYEAEQQASATLRLYAKNNQGYANLLQLATILGHKEEKEPFLTREEMLPHLREVLVVLPSRTGPLDLWLQEGQYPKALDWINRWKGGTESSDWFLAIEEDYGDDYEARKAFAQVSGLRLLAAPPVFFTEKEDVSAYQVARSIQQGSRLADSVFTDRERIAYLHSPAEMSDRFQNVPEALHNSELLASACTVQLTLGERRMPKFKAEAAVPAEKQLRHLCEQGLKERYQQVTEPMLARLEHELGTIIRMGFSDYFLIVWDILRYARQRQIHTGPGRGSAAGSLVAYALYITHVDPLKYELLFERFLNPERVSLPDIDLDFPDHRRDEIIAYVKEKYGERHVAQILTFGTLAAKAVIRDVGKALGLGTVTEQIAKEVPASPGITLEKALRGSTRLQQLIKQSTEAEELWTLATQLEGLPKHSSTHAAGVVISAEPLPEIVALQAGQGGMSLTQATMEVVEELGLLKFDFLGLRNLTLLERIVQLVHEQHRPFNLAVIPLDDAPTYQLLGAGDTTGIFQLESQGMRRTLIDLKPTDFEDIVAVNALYRPGPMKFIDDYIRGKRQPEQVHYLHPDLEPVLAKTYGVIIYQEQIMQIASVLAGFSLAEADLLRRAISKKNKVELARQKEAFQQGALRQGYGSELAEQVFALIERFADYGFNRSHAVAYSMLSYQLAYLKAHYPLAFYTALLSSVWHHHEKLAHHLQECRQAGYRILPPSLSKSGQLFTGEQSAIRFGLLPIAHVGVKAVQAILTERERKPFSDLFDFVVRVDTKLVNKKAIEQLIKAGALDEFAEDRATLLHSLQAAFEFADTVKSFQEETAGLFTVEVPPPQYEAAEPLTVQEKLDMEREALGFYLSSHPVEMYKEKLEGRGRRTLSEALTAKGVIRAAGLVVQVREIKTKKNEQMAFAKLSDEAGEAEVVAFPSAWKAAKELFKEGELLFVEGRADAKRQQLIIEKAIRLQQLTVEPRKLLFLRILPETASKIEQVKAQLQAYPGTVPVVLYHAETKEKKILPQDWYVNAADECLDQLIGLLGKENVVLQSYNK